MGGGTSWARTADFNLGDSQARCVVQGIPDLFLGSCPVDPNQSSLGNVSAQSVLF